jgi:type IV secretory pathway VirB10-like protein
VRPFRSRVRLQAACAAAAFCLLAGGLRAQGKSQTPVVICEGTQALANSHQAEQAKKPENAGSITLRHRPAASENFAVNSKVAQLAPHETIALTVPQGTPIQVVLDKEIRIHKVGQPIDGRVAQAIYSFDKLVVPANSEAIGKITHIEGVSDGRRAEAALNANFTPAPKVDVEFSELVLPDGKHIPIRTKVTPGSGQVIQFVSVTGGQKTGIGGEISRKKKEAEKQVHAQWDAAIGQVKAPGKLHRVERYLLAELPFHPHYINAGTVYFAELESPLHFGSEPLTPALAESIAHPKLPDGSVVQARLLTPLNSATAHWGDKVTAIVSRPLFNGKRLVVPEGSLLKGTILQASPARRMSRNGKLRPMFHQLSLPDGIEQQVEASLAGVQAGKAQGLKLDAEGGAEATTPKSRYLDTALAVTLAAASQGDDLLNQGEGGAGGFRLIGFAVGLAVRYQPLGAAMGAFGASRSIYTHFFATGRNVVLPKYTAMDITIGTQPSASRSAVADPVALRSAHP